MLFLYVVASSTGTLSNFIKLEPGGDGRGWPSCSDLSSTSRQMTRSTRPPGVEALDCTDFAAPALKQDIIFDCLITLLGAFLIEASNPVLLLWDLPEAEVPMASELPPRTSSMLWQR